MLAVVQLFAFALIEDVRLQGAHLGVVGAEGLAAYGVLDAPVDHVAKQRHATELRLGLRVRLRLALSGLGAAGRRAGDPWAQYVGLPNTQRARAVHLRCHHRLLILHRERAVAGIGGRCAAQRYGRRSQEQPMSPRDSLHVGKPPSPSRRFRAISYWRWRDNVNLSALTIQQLRYLVAVEHHRSFRDAAASCHVSQPALSTQIKKVEELLGVAIFDRSRQPIVTTARGVQVVEEARIVLEHVERIGAIAAADTGLSGPYRLGVIPTLLATFVPLFLRRFTATHPRVELSIEETPTDSLLRRLREGTLDAGLAATPLEVPGVHEMVIAHEPMFVYLPPSHPLAERSRIRQRDLVGEHVWLLSEGHCFRTQVLHLCSADRSSSFESFRVNLECSSFETLIGLVDSGVGITVLPDLVSRTLSLSQRAGQLRRFATPEPARQIGVVVTREQARREITDALVEALRSGLPPDLQAPKNVSVLSPVSDEAPRSHRRSAP